MMREGAAREPIVQNRRVVRTRTARSELNEDDLIALLRRRDGEAMSILYDRYAGTLLGVIQRMLRSAELAEDALQETFIKIWNNFDSFDPSKGRLFTWMVRLARNVALDTIKSRTFRNTQQNQEIGSVVDLVDSRASAGDDSDRIGLNEIVRSLRPEQEQVIELIYFQGYTQDEASRELGIPLGTVKTRVRAAISTIRKIFS